MPVRTALVWVALVLAAATALGAALSSPLLEWRGPIYIVAGIAGVIGLVLLLLQPLLGAGLLPGVPLYRGRRVHRWTGAALLLMIIIHVAGLWITSPPDMIDALLFRSPTPFSAWGVVAMWAVFATAAAALMRLRLRLRTWQFLHGSLAAVIVVGSVVHAMLIEGTMETVSKAALCALALAATAKALFDLNLRRRRRAKS